MRRHCLPTFFSCLPMEPRTAGLLGARCCLRFRAREPVRIATPTRQAANQRGAGATGFLLAAVPLLMLGMGGIEVAHWANLRLILGQALVQAARAGATHQAQPLHIAQAFEASLRMAWPDDSARRRILQQRRQALGVPWHMLIQQPSPAAFLDHADASLRKQSTLPGQRQIRNNYQAVQHAHRLQQGWPHGRGPRSGVDIHEANTLVITLNWPHRPFLPGLAALMRTLAPWATDARQASWMAAGFLPFRRHVRLAMHSHPAQWPDLPDGRITHATGARTDLQPIEPDPPATQDEASTWTPAPDAPAGPGEPQDTDHSSNETDLGETEADAPDTADGTPDRGTDTDAPEDASLQCGPDP